MSSFEETSGLSFEVFPPKTAVSNQKIYQTLHDLQDLRPNFISVTSSNRTLNFENSTLKLADYVQNTLGIPGVVHLTARYFDKSQIDQVLIELKKLGIKNILVLRGDLAPGCPPKKDFNHASDLMTYIKSQDSSFRLFGACYPESHPESPDKVSDIHHLKAKVAAGCDCLITQMFFSNDTFYQFQENCALADIDVPLLAGIMPIVNRAQALHVLKQSECHLPAKFTLMLDRYQNDPEALRAAGLAYAINQITDLVTNQIAGVHLYTMNQPAVARYIYQATKSLFTATCSPY
ncbi:MAG: methylenetetrahydrofolate reductase [NAD(P)H] [Liquorilactobacillus ghanensis]|jgi:methylenetetrahydrofolate reductase (NADPH)|uniref:methylenetetrahydrofolate reductase [NAD(P)H] n=1 Tax=Liquorilactobacillus ghanensis TaxID=399370 RepID=UPI0039EAD22E